MEVTSTPGKGSTFWFTMVLDKAVTQVGRAGVTLPTTYLPFELSRATSVTLVPFLA